MFKQNQEFEVLNYFIHNNNYYATGSIFKIQDIEENEDKEYPNKTIIWIDYYLTSEEDIFAVCDILELDEHELTCLIENGNLVAL